ncbi:CsbD family protein [Lichenihabitans psoromatis]|uniref:CsbD family protein n=1 Tax=Lichenihabitans psoromatis TaxID=2528642 RepID=UPI0013F153AF|nr:CsbD family protein [Lichenihabitans psoromatis]
MNSDRIDGTAQEIGGKIQQTVGMATGSGRLRAEGLAREVGGKSQNLYGQAKDGLKDAADSVSNYAEEAYERGSVYVQQGAETVETTINQHPVTGIVLAGAIGFLLGLVVSQRR